jgi:predicted adenine nucleotide alpha hydrolase (AANH) superfamily ATPase
MAKTVLLHVCCGPCCIMPVTRLRAEGYAVTAYFMNPNIQPLAEYLRRREALAAVAQSMDFEVLWDDRAWDMTAWLAAVAGKQDSAPARCTYCYSTRLEASYAKAKALGFDAFSSSLLYSKYQQHEGIARLGAALAGQGGPAFVYRDFRTDWQEGIDRSKAMEIYRQPYCGCVYSEVERYAKKLKKLQATQAG